MYCVPRIHSCGYSRIHRRRAVRNTRGSRRRILLFKLLFICRTTSHQAPDHPNSLIITETLRSGQRLPPRGAQRTINGTGSFYKVKESLCESSLPQQRNRSCMSPECFVAHGPAVAFIQPNIVRYVDLSLLTVVYYHLDNGYPASIAFVQCVCLRDFSG